MDMTQFLSSMMGGGGGGQDHSSQLGSHAGGFNAGISFGTRQTATGQNINTGLIVAGVVVLVLVLMKGRK